MVVVARDEAHQIAECLRSVQGFADETILIDTGSSDGTPGLARALATVIPFGPEASGSPGAGPGAPSTAPPLIHAAKNFGTSRARGPWILSLDADERLTEGLKREIHAFLAAPAAQTAACALPFTHYFFGRYLRHGGFQGHIVRLFRKGRLRYPEDRAHSTPEVDGRILRMENPLVHFNHPRITDFVRKMNLYTSQDAPLMARLGRGGLRGRLAPMPTRWSILRCGLGVFWNRFVRHRGFLDGVHGLAAAALLAAYQVVESAKLWEALQKDIVGIDTAPLPGQGGRS